MTPISKAVARRLLLFGAVGVVLACGDDPLGPFQPEVANAPDNFQAQATDVTGVSATRTYSWPNTGTRATINHSTTTSEGSARVVIRDAGGTIVYEKALSPSLNEPTATGAAGLWSIELRLSTYSGTLNFRAQKL